MTVDDGGAAIAVRPATASDAPVVREVLDEARRWLAERGIAQWTSPFGEAWIAQRIAAGEMHVACQGVACIAVVRLLWEDATFWGERELGDAVYVRTLAVRRALAGRGLGGQMLDWAAAEGRRRGRRRLRLDCAAVNEALVAYYLGQGFLPAGEVAIAGERMVLLERAIGT